MFAQRYCIFTRCLLLFSLPCYLTSCTYLSPSISLVKPATVQVCNSADSKDSETWGSDSAGNPVVIRRIANDPQCKMPALYKASVSITNSLDQLEKKRNWSLSTNRALGLATFGLGVGAVANGIHSGNGNSIKNASLGAGVAYMSSTLFTPISQVQTYQSGLVALTCIENKASQSLALSISAFAEFNAINSIVCRREVPVQSAFFKTLVVANYAKNNDVLLANAVTSTANIILNDLNDQIINQTPSPTSFYEAARGAGKLPPFVETNLVKVSDAQDLMLKAQNKCSVDDNELIAKYAEIEEKFKQSVNELDMLGEQCTLAKPNIEPLIVGEAEYTLTKDSEIYQINVSGGRKPYYRYINTPLKGVSIQMGTDTLIIAKNGDLAAGENESIVTIKDSSLVPQVKQIKVKSKTP